MFLIVLGLAWIIGAVMQDAKRREVDNIWNFSLVAIALLYRAFLSVFYSDYWFFVNGLIGFGFFYVVANLLYYSRLFAGGDAKLLIGLGAILPFSVFWFINLKIFGAYIIFLLFSGGIYALAYSLVLVSTNYPKFRMEFSRQYKRYKKYFLVPIILSLLWLVFVFAVNQIGFIFISLIILFSPALFVFAKAVEESCMIKKVLPEKVTEGDWLYKDIIVGGEKIRSNWEGVSRKELAIIRKTKKPILIKEGIPFTPSFLIGFLVLVYVCWKYSWIFFYDIFI